MFPEAVPSLSFDNSAIPQSYLAHFDYLMADRPAGFEAQLLSIAEHGPPLALSAFVDVLDGSRLIPFLTAAPLALTRLLRRLPISSCRGVVQTLAQAPISPPIVEFLIGASTAFNAIDLAYIATTQVSAAYAEFTQAPSQRSRLRLRMCGRLIASLSKTTPSFAQLPQIQDANHQLKECNN
jgi:hypothetical protein